MSNCLVCPNCGDLMPLIDCEKTTYCDNCKKDWKYDDESNLEEVEENDDIYLDR